MKRIKFRLVEQPGCTGEFRVQIKKWYGWKYIYNYNGFWIEYPEIKNLEQAIDVILERQELKRSLLDLIQYPSLKRH